MSRDGFERSFFFIFVLTVMLTTFAANTAMGQDPASKLTANTESFLKADTPVAIAYIIGVVVLKVTAFILGYFIVRLGHDTLIKGVTGDFDFGFTGGGVNTKLKAAAPGTFFVLAGAAIIMWGLFVTKPYEIEMRVKMPVEITQNSSQNATPDPVLP